MVRGSWWYELGHAMLNTIRVRVHLSHMRDLSRHRLIYLLINKPYISRGRHADITAGAPG